MPTISSRPRFRLTSLFLSMLIVLIVVALGWAAYARRRTHKSRMPPAAASFSRACSVTPRRSASAC